MNQTGYVAPLLIAASFAGALRLIINLVALCRVCCHSEDIQHG